MMGVRLSRAEQRLMLRRCCASLPFWLSSAEAPASPACASAAL